MKKYIKPATMIVCLNTEEILNDVMISNSTVPQGTQSEEDGQMGKGHGFFDDWETPTGTNIWDDDDE